MLRKFTFKDDSSNTELLLPVTPSSFEMTHGMKVETINIHALGDVNIAGYTTLATITIEGMFPAQDYVFALTPTVNITNNYSYIDYFQNWINNRVVIRFIISGTKINIPVLVEDIKYGEKDGTNDLYYSLTLREYRQVKPIKIESSSSTASNSIRAVAAPPSTAQTYTIQRGDNLSYICRKFYGNANLYNKLAKYNGIKNPNLIYTGNVLKIPSLNILNSY